VGIALAWISGSTSGYHAVMNLLLLPLWFLSGALFPPEGAPAWLGWVMRFDPLTYGLAALRHALHSSGGPAPGAALVSPALAWGVTAGFALLGHGLATLAARRRVRAE
jgi:ABC-2 type transport system permease protein